jgi:hypothetical protein
MGTWRSQIVTALPQRIDNENYRSSQIVMIDNFPKNRTGKYLPYAFTEHGVENLLFNTKIF